MNGLSGFHQGNVKSGARPLKIATFERHYGLCPTGYAQTKIVPKWHGPTL